MSNWVNKVPTLYIHCPCCGVPISIDVLKERATKIDMRVKQTEFVGSCSEGLHKLPDFRMQGKNGKLYCRRCGKEV
jgi:ribosomal protein L37E